MPAAAIARKNRMAGAIARPSFEGNATRANMTPHTSNAPPHAEHAGDQVTPAVRRAVDRARNHLDANFDRPVTLAQLAAVCGLSPHHLQRGFKAVVGVSPREYQRARRLGRLKARLLEGETVSRATYDAGFGSPSRIYERARAELGMTPAAYRAGGQGIEIRFTTVATPIGELLVAATDRGVCAVTLGDDAATVEAALGREFPRAVVRRDDAGMHHWAHEIASSLAGAPLEPLPLDVPGTDFQWEVWRALQAIPPGSTRSYRDIAVAIGRPTSARAVAGACASNKVALLIPCHRVVRGEGTMGGYRWGVERKRALLEREKSASARHRERAAV